jgi:hypothetical protein
VRASRGLGRFRLQATDSGNPTKTGIATFTINIIDVNEQPKFVTPFVSSISLAENSPRGTWLGYYPVVRSHPSPALPPPFLISLCV